MGGAERQGVYLVEHLKRLGADVEVLAFEDGEVVRKDLDHLGVKVVAFPYYFRWPRAKRARALGSLVRLLRSEIKPDALLPFVGIHSKTMAMAWPYTGARFCWWNQQDEGRDLTGTRVESRVLRKVSTINSNSYAGRDFLAGTYGLDPGSIHVYNNGTPIPERAETGVWRTREQLGERKIVSMIANVTQFKDHETLIRAWKMVRDRSRDAQKPVLILAGHLREADTVRKLKIQAFELGLSGDDVRFPGPVDDVQPLFADSDLVVHSSLTEGCPNAVCEAMAMRRAVVATDISGSRQALGTEGVEWLAVPRNSQDLAERIIRLLENAELRNSVGDANRQRIASHFTIEAMNQFFQAEIEKGLGRSIA
jgi:glycosyltransferase involved in cell wall biosynthesis